MSIDAYEHSRHGAVYLRWMPAGPWRYRGQADALAPGNFAYDAERWYLAGEHFALGDDVTMPEDVYFIARFHPETGAIDLERWDDGGLIADLSAHYVHDAPWVRWNPDSCPQCTQPAIADYNRAVDKLIGWNSDGQQVRCEGCATLVERSFDGAGWSPWRVKGVRR